MKLKSVLIGLLSLLATFSCTKAPDDPFCRYEPLPASSGVPAGQGGISPWAKANYVDHALNNQASVLRFIEDNWGLGRIGDQSFDEGSGRCVVRVAGEGPAIARRHSLLSTVRLRLSLVRRLTTWTMCCPDLVSLP